MALTRAPEAPINRCIPCEKDDPEYNKNQDVTIMPSGNRFCMSCEAEWEPAMTPDELFEVEIILGWNGDTVIMASAQRVVRDNIVWWVGTQLEVNKISNSTEFDFWEAHWIRAAKHFASPTFRTTV